MTRLHGAALRARREAVVELWRQGQSAATIAATLGLPFGTVENDVKRARKVNPDGVPRRQRAPLTAVQCAEISALNAEGRNPAAIARALRVGDLSVRRALRIAAMAETARDPRPAIGAIRSQIVAMWEAGHTARAVADRFGLARVEYVHRVIGRMVPELRRQKEHRARGKNMLQQVAALRQQNRSYREIACALGIPLYTVTYYVHRGLTFGTIARRGPVVSNAQRQEIIALNAAGGSSGREIARRLNFSPDTIYRVLRLAGVAPSVVAQQQLKSKILELWEAGWKSDAIADVCGITVKYVWAAAYQAARKNPALRRQAPPLSAAEIERIAALRRENHYSGREIAQLTDVAYPVVHRVIGKIAQSEPGLGLHKRLIAKNRLPEVLLLMAQGLPPAVIAERFGVDRASMRALLYRLRRRAKNRGGLVSPGVELQSLPEG
jgi:DNA-binding CsgD family transcriptional regulator